MMSAHLREGTAARDLYLIVTRWPVVAFAICVLDVVIREVV